MLGKSDLTSSYNGAVQTIQSGSEGDEDVQQRLINVLLVVGGKKYFIQCGVEADGFVVFVCYGECRRRYQLFLLLRIPVQ